MREGVVAQARVIRAASRVAWADLRTIYTPVTWSVGWLGRIIMQVIFFALIGTLLGDPDAVRYLFVGQAVFACALECMMAVPSTTWERNAGTLALLVASPAPLWPVFAGRSLQWLPSGMATSMIVMFAVGPFFGVTWTLTGALLAVPVLAAVAASTYAIALTLAAVVLRGRRWRNVVSNVAGMVITIVGGVAFPASVLPAALAGLGQAVPLTHGLAAIRALQEGGGPVLVPFALTVLTGVLWAGLAAVAFTLFGETGRRDGSIDFAE